MELPEVEVVRRELEKDVVGRRISSVDVRRSANARRIIRRHDAPKELRDRLLDRKITGVDRIGKYLLLRLDDGGVIVAHFGMSGRFLLAQKKQHLDPHTHVTIGFKEGRELRFIDPRSFGELFSTTVDELGKVRELQHLALDPLEQAFTWQQFSQLLAERKAQLKPLLMDQEFISGLGNIYSDEVLFAAGLAHDRRSDELSSQEVRRLYRAVVEVLLDAIRARGTTLDDEAYVGLTGKPGEFQEELRVYGRAGEPCRRCRTPIEVVKRSRRSAYFCPQCQS
ncbi:MAG: bifunctional DNA-formamidopyrimidine glycosylase/DNA-(apurinic or apyrimidinic site) lyase [Actinomycetota bacterium]